MYKQFCVTDNVLKDSKRWELEGGVRSPKSGVGGER